MNTQNLIHSIIQRIATGPELSKNIETEEVEAAMSAILNGEIDDVQSAIFFIALRMKRETIDENIGILKAIVKATNPQRVDVENLIDIGDPYCGYNRSVPVSSFLPPLFAELGLPTIIHGLDSVSPKFGLTHRDINLALGLDSEISISDAKSRIENKSIGWSYLDQSIYCKELNQLVPLRNKIIKRTVLNTVETLIGPLRGKNTHSILGYVHKPYPPIYAALTNSVGFNTTLLIRGVEGGIVPSLRQKSIAISYIGGIETASDEINPKIIGINQELRAISFPRNMNIESGEANKADYVVTLGKAALSGEKGMFYDGLVFAASLILLHVNKVDSIEEGAAMVRQTLDSGRALKRLI